MNNQIALYQQVILDHNRNPKNFKKLCPASHFSEGYNPLCGDHLWVYLNVCKNKTISDISFNGEGCAISKASASLMTDIIKGKSIRDVKELSDIFLNMLKDPNNKDLQLEKIGKLKIFSGVSKYPSRIKCASLCWHALIGALSSDQKVSTEE
ncbi:MAG: SUF system NifU family Fe-S cluster assembly protein [Zetaproteobacteria bacterium]|nr:SUF system NifU family Fe-S cluster assembly protein [Pseudobdellovibrionaceae bacterium]|tara:strand:+ start:3057 stop:3512 length:456 start_codon:yes stop_codon:yes gene_type:complete